MCYTPFFFTDTATTEIYTLSLHDALPICVSTGACIGHISPEALSGGPIGKLRDGDLVEIVVDRVKLEGVVNFVGRSEEHTSELQSRLHLVCRLLLEKKKQRHSFTFAIILT